MIIALIVWVIIRIVRYSIIRFSQPRYTIHPALIHTKKKILRKGVFISIIGSLILIPLDLKIPIQKPSLILIVDSSQSMYSQESKPTRILQAMDIIDILSDQQSIKHCFTQTSWTHIWCNRITTIPNSGSALGDMIGVATSLYSWSFVTYIVFTDGWINKGIPPEQIIDKNLQDHIIRVDITPWKKNIMISWYIVGVNNSNPTLSKSIKSLPYYYSIERQEEKDEVASLITKKLINDQSYYSINKRLWLWVILATSWMITYQLFSSPWSSYSSPITTA